jgi:hypothetical protein
MSKVYNWEASGSNAAVKCIEEWTIEDSLLRNNEPSQRRAGDIFVPGTQ